MMVVVRVAHVVRVVGVVVGVVGVVVGVVGVVVLVLVVIPRAGAGTRVVGIIPEVHAHQQIRQQIVPNRRHRRSNARRVQIVHCDDKKHLGLRWHPADGCVGNDMDGDAIVDSIGRENLIVQDSGRKLEAKGCQLAVGVQQHGIAQNCFGLDMAALVLVRKDATASKTFRIKQVAVRQGGDLQDHFTGTMDVRGVPVAGAIEGVADVGIDGQHLTNAQHAIDRDVRDRLDDRNTAIIFRACGIGITEVLGGSSHNAEGGCIWGSVRHVEWVRREDTLQLRWGYKGRKMSYRCCGGAESKTASRSAATRSCSSFLATRRLFATRRL